METSYRRRAGVIHLGGGGTDRFIWGQMDNLRTTLRAEGDHQAPDTSPAIFRTTVGCTTQHSGVIEHSGIQTANRSSTRVFERPKPLNIHAAALVNDPRNPNP